MTAEFPPLYLKRREDRRIRAGHPWVFSNEINIERSPLTAFEAGAPVVIHSHANQVLGTGYVNPGSLICARILVHGKASALDEEWLDTRIGHALALRGRLYSHDQYRLVYGESDGLPGLVVDRYDDVLVVQTATAGMERMRTQVVESLCRLVKPRVVILRNDGAGRSLEGLDSYVDVVVGESPETVEVEEGSARFQVSPLTGQKTGWYYDHRPNRARMLAYVPERRVLDVFSYCGAWGVQAAVAGADSVVCVDSSEVFLQQATENAERNGVASTVSVQRGDAFAVLKELHSAGERFGVVVLDPPAFIRRKKDLRNGIEAYRRINRLAVQLLEADGILISASCSYHLSRDELLRVVQHGTRATGRTGQVLEEGHQGPDHPVLPVLPESGYLKAFFVRVS